MNRCKTAQLAAKVVAGALVFMTCQSSAFSQTGNRDVAHEFAQSMGLGNNFMAAKAMGFDGAPEDYQLLKANGFGHCRIGHKFNEVAGSAPDYLVPADHMQHLQDMVDWCLAEGLIAVVDPLHDWGNANDPLVEFDVTVDLPKLEKIWEQVATRFASYSTAEVAFEVINEPHEDHDVAQIISTSLAAIRGVAGNEQRIVIVPGDGFSTRQAVIDALATDQIPANDDYLIATFHYYDPKTFTKQNSFVVGETWGTISETDDEHAQVWIDFSAVKNANNVWADRHGTDPLPIYLGEYGVDRVSPTSSREEWLRWIGQVATDYGFVLCHWNMYSGEGLGKGTGTWSNEVRDDPSLRAFDTNIVDALVAGSVPSGTIYPVIFEVTEDVSAKQAQADVNQGGSSVLELRQDGASTFGRVAYLKFNVSGMSLPLEQALLHIAVENELDLINVHEVTDNSWSEFSLTWNDRPLMGAVLGTVQGATDEWVTLDVTATVAGNGTYSFALDETGNSYQRVYARESGNGAYLEVIERENLPPVWSQNPVTISDATEGEVYTKYINWLVTDAEGDTLNFVKVSGPEWLSVENALNGKLVGTPSIGDIGETHFVISVDDGYNPTVEATIIINVVGWAELAYDDFENGIGNYTDGGSDSSLNSGINGFNGSQSYKIQDNSAPPKSCVTLTNGVDVSSYTELQVEFWYNAVGFETGEDFFLDYWDGAQWVVVRGWMAGTDFENGANSAVVPLIGVTMSTDMKIRFRCDASNNSDKIYLDNIRISAR